MPIKAVTSYHVSADTPPDQYFLEMRTNLLHLQQEDVYTDLILLSGENRARVHQAVLLPLSPFLQNLVPVSSCPCTTPAITLPPSHKNTLLALIELIYTGRSNVESQSAKEEFEELVENLQINVKVNYEKTVLMTQHLTESVLSIRAATNSSMDGTMAAQSKTTDELQISDFFQFKMLSPSLKIGTTPQSLEKTVKSIKQLKTLKENSIEVAEEADKRPNSAIKNIQLCGELAIDSSDSFGLIQIPKTARSQKRKVHCSRNESHEKNIVPDKKKKLDFLVQQSKEVIKLIINKDIKTDDSGTFAEAKEDNSPKSQEYSGGNPIFLSFWQGAVEEID